MGTKPQFIVTIPYLSQERIEGPERRCWWLGGKTPAENVADMLRVAEADAAKEHAQATIPPAEALAMALLYSRGASSSSAGAAQPSSAAVAPPSSVAAAQSSSAAAAQSQSAAVAPTFLKKEEESRSPIASALAGMAPLVAVREEIKTPIKSPSTPDSPTGVDALAVQPSLPEQTPDVARPPPESKRRPQKMPRGSIAQDRAAARETTAVEAMASLAGGILV